MSKSGEIVGGRFQRLEYSSDKLQPKGSGKALLFAQINNVNLYTFSARVAVRALQPFDFNWVLCAAASAASFLFSCLVLHPFQYLLLRNHTNSMMNAVVGSATAK